MISRGISSTSKIIALFKYLYRRYENFLEAVGGLCRNSFIFRLVNNLCAISKISFRHSLFGKLSEINQKETRILDNSRAAQYLTNLYNGYKEKLTSILENSSAVFLIKDIKKRLPFLPVRIIGIVVISAISMNIAISIIIQKHLYFWEWIMRSQFLFLGILALFCKVDWLTIKKGSIFLKIVKVGQNGS